MAGQSGSNKSQQQSFIRNATIRSQEAILGPLPTGPPKKKKGENVLDGVEEEEEQEDPRMKHVLFGSHFTTGGLIKSAGVNKSVLLYPDEATDWLDQIKKPKSGSETMTYRSVFLTTHSRNPLDYKTATQGTSCVFDWTTPGHCVLAACVHVV